MRLLSHPLATRARHAACALAFSLAGTSHAASIDLQVFAIDGYVGTQALAFCGRERLIGGVIDSTGTPSGAAMTAAGGLRRYKLPGETTTRPQTCQNGQVMGVTFGGRFGFRSRGFVSTPGAGTLYITVPEGSLTTVRGISASGVVVGYHSPDALLGRTRGFVYRDGKSRDYTRAGNINQLMGVLDDGTLYGWYTDEATSEGRDRGFIDRDGTLTVIDVPGAYNTHVTGMNRNGVVVGYFNTAFGGSHQGFALINGEFITFAPTDAADTYAWSVDDTNRVVGYSFMSGGLNGVSFIGTVAP